MRSLYSFKNIISGIGGQFIAFLLQFVSRTIFIKTLGTEYLGISGLFTNILNILSISELGIGAAIVYSLYKPLSEKDTYKIHSIMNYLKKSYFIIGCVILVLGSSLIPFLPYIIKGSTDLVYINNIYLLYLFQSVSSYWFFAYKSALLRADQKEYIINIANYIIIAITTLIQVMILLLFKSFIIYIIIGVTSNIFKNIILACRVNILYPYLKRKKNIVLLKEDKKAINKNIFGLTMYKISSTVLTSTDNIIISSFIGINIVGLFSNYTLITNTVSLFVRIIFSSFISSIGNLYVSESKEKSEQIFRCINFLNFWVYGTCSVCLLILIKPFITLWLGQSFLLDSYVALFIVIDFLTAGLQSAVISYKDACGLFWQGKYRPIASAALNIIFSIVLVKPLGITGVFLGTIISRFLSTWWFDPWLVHKYAFNISPIRYYFRYFRSLIIVAITIIIVYIICIPFQTVSFLNLIIKGIICVVTPNILFYILFKNSFEFEYIINKIKDLFKKGLKV
ncbi:MAG: oligosaccharide flippase family protein [Bacilli bacterium]|nr:oligosaccharide flippase family protein [Bacilli bacterium]